MKHTPENPTPPHLEPTPRGNTITILCETCDYRNTRSPQPYLDAQIHAHEHHHRTRVIRKVVIIYDAADFPTRIHHNPPEEL